MCTIIEIWFSSSAQSSRRNGHVSKNVIESNNAVNRKITLAICID